ncbi:MAG: aspartate 1-decarboxylase [Planctomycetota bacterium]|nr:MAG: aspartate 1-decarboxylase [Planctomycetota bacterium]
MLREMFVGKLHRATVSRTEIDYPGSLTVDVELLERAGIPVHGKVQVVNINNGARFETYVIPGEPGEIIVNGAAARLAQAGDRIIIIAYALLSDDEIAQNTPIVVVLDERNRVVAG